MKKLKEKWGITSNFQLFIICIVFAITGSASAIVSGPIIKYLFGNLSINPFLKFIFQLIIIMPIYQVLLLFFGSIFFQFNFFFKFVKKFMKFLGLGILFRD
ncbi:MAG: diacylglyceryl transferase [Pelagibacterales bacterium]|nr:diacylglyceryl transferase [Pelagibacterales bacterium]